MSCHAGPDIVENGLVFCYDMNNTQKSWRGKPTTNLLTDPSNFNSISWIKARNTGSLPTVIKENILDRNGVLKEIDKLTLPSDGTYPRIHQYWTPANTTTHTFSIYLKNAGGTVSTCDIVIFRNSPWTGVSYNTVNLTSSWRLFTVSFNPLDTTTHMIYIGSHDSAKGAIFYLADAQLEINLFATPFVNGSRSNTQAILDLTNNNTITATNLTYNSDGTFSFDGSYNYIQSPNNCSITGSVTLSAWIKPSRIGQTGPHSTILCTDTNYPYGVKLMNFKNSTRCVLWLGFGGTTSYEASISNDINDNSIKMLTGTWDMSTGNVNMYINGELQNTINTGYTIPVVLYDGKITLGTDYHNIGSGTLNKYLGNIYSAFIYNRALSSDEVKQNFNATRRIYGI